MNNKLDEQVMSLFLKMIESWDKITDIVFNNIHFGNKLTLKITNYETDKSNEYLSISNMGDYNKGFIGDPIDPKKKLTFYIYTEYREYVVPEITDILEYARVLNTIEESLKKFEAKKLSELVNYFSVKDPCSDCTIEE